MKHLISFAVAVVCGYIVVMALNFLAPTWISAAATGFNGRIGDLSNYFNVHLTIWIAFFMGMFSVGQNLLSLQTQQAYASGEILNRAPNIIYDREDRRAIYMRASNLPEGAIIRQMVLRALAQFQGSKSWTQANEVLQATTIEIQQRIELNYTVVRYLTWLIPTLGFIGTVVGISSALGQVGLLTPEDFADASFLPEVVGLLGTAFSTTMMALILSGILILFTSVVQASEETFVTNLFSDCVEHLLNKLHEDENG